MKFLKPRMRRPFAVAPDWAISPVAHGGRTADLTGQASPFAVIPTGLGYWPLTPRVVFLATTQTPKANARNTAFCTYLLSICCATPALGLERPCAQPYQANLSCATGGSQTATSAGILTCRLPGLHYKMRSSLNRSGSFRPKAARILAGLAQTIWWQARSVFEGSLLGRQIGRPLDMGRFVLFTGGLHFSVSLGVALFTGILARSAWRLWAPLSSCNVRGSRHAPDS
jgi:hypothetical protein